jgi:hypothetical protein
MRVPACAPARVCAHACLRIALPAHYRSWHCLLVCTRDVISGMLQEAQSRKRAFARLPSLVLLSLRISSRLYPYIRHVRDLSTLALILPRGPCLPQSRRREPLRVVRVTELCPQRRRDVKATNGPRHGVRIRMLFHRNDAHIAAAGAARQSRRAAHASVPHSNILSRRNTAHMRQISHDSQRKTNGERQRT